MARKGEQFKGEKIKELRQSSKITLRELAQKLGNYMPHQVLHSWEIGQYKPLDPETAARKLADFFKVKPETFFPMKKIHPTAIVSKIAEIGEDVEIGPYAIINEDVKIDSGTKIFSHVLIDSGTRIGKNCQIYQGAVLGGEPQDLKFAGEKTNLRIGDNTIIREYAVISRGTKQRGETTVGNNCFLMAYAHVAHDCIIGNNVILANAVNLAGHVEIQEFAIIGGVVPVHQFVRIGAHSIIGGGFRVPMDVCPYMLAAGYPLKIYGVNKIGLQRRGFSPPTIGILEKVYKILFRSKFNTSQALKKIRSDFEMIPEVQNILEFIEKSDRGIVK